MSAVQIIITIVLVAVFETILYLVTSFVMWDLSWVAAAGPFVLLTRLVVAAVGLMGGFAIAALLFEDGTKQSIKKTTSEG